MSFLGTRGPSAQEVARENYIKKNITETLGLALKTLQRRHVNSEEPIYSEDSANTVCNIIEAVFLHGLKSSFTHKLSSYLIGVDPGRNLQPCFWELLVRFSHKDVVSQLNHLGQITTEIGMCRAWIRVSLNDGVLESYLDAILADGASVRHFYKRTAFLRDEEQAGIMKSYIQGLLAFSFQLSYNSSVLNLWTTTPLVMAGLVEQTVAPRALMSTSRSDGAIMRHTSDAGEHPASEAISGESQVARRGRASEARIVSSNSYNDNLRRRLSKTPPNTPFDVSGLSRADIEEIRKFAEQARTTGSASTPTSQISCPDYVVDSHLLSPDGESEAVEAAIQVARRNERIENDLLNAFGADRDDITSRSIVVTKGKRSKHRPKSDRSCDDQAVPSTRQEENQPKQITNTASGAASCEAQNQDDQVDNHIETTQESAPCDSSASGATATDTTQTIQKNSKESMPKIPVPEQLFLRKSEPLEPVLSTVTALVEVAKEVCPATHFSSDSDEAVVINTDGEEEYGIYDSYGPSPQGNKLEAMQGWSSEFQEREVPFGRVGEEHVAEVSMETGTTPARNNTEPRGSYGDLLQNYVPGPLNALSMSQVLEELPDSPDSQTQLPNQALKEEDPSYLDEYEVLSVGINITSDQADSRTQQLVSLIGLICNEKGLDQQNYQCKGCSRPIGMIYGKARVCMYDGGYYCYECHENEEYYIPSRIVHNWDLRKHKVACHTLQFLRQIEDNPLINIQNINPRLYNHVPEVKDILELRIQLRFLKAYLFTCKQTVADDLRKQVWPKEYLYDDIHVYALQDLLQIPSGQLAATLRKLIKYSAKHVYECRLCSQKGFICEVCDSPKVIYPFQVDTTSRCDQCNAVFHKDCKPSSKPCPKCERRKQRQMSLGNNILSPDTIDYAYQPD